MLPIDIIQSGLARTIQPTAPVAPVGKAQEGESDESPLDRSERSISRGDVNAASSVDAVTATTRRVTATPEADSARLQSRSRTAPRPVVTEVERNQLAAAAADLLAPVEVGGGIAEISAAAVTPSARTRGEGSDRTSRSALDARPVATEAAGAAGRPSRQVVGMPPYPPSQKAVAAGEAAPPRVLMPPPPFTPEPPRSSVQAAPSRPSRDLGVGAGMDVRLPGVGAGSVVTPASVELKKLVEPEPKVREARPKAEAPQRETPQRETPRPSRQVAEASPRVGAGMAVRMPGVGAGSVVTPVEVELRKLVEADPKSVPAKVERKPVERPAREPQRASAPSNGDDLGVGAGMRVRVPGIGAGSIVEPAKTAARKSVEDEVARSSARGATDGVRAAAMTETRGARAEFDAPATAPVRPSRAGAADPAAAAAAQSQQAAQAAGAQAAQQNMARGLGLTAARAGLGV